MRLLLTLLFLASLSVSAQQSSIDSLTRLLPTLSDTNQVNALNYIAYKYLAFEPPKAKQYANKALLQAQRIGFIRGEAEALKNLGDYEFRQSNYAKSMEFGTQAIKVASQLGDSLVIAEAYRLMGNVHTFGFRQYDEALGYQLRALKIIKKGNDPRKLAALYGSLTWIYSVTKRNLKEASQLAREGVNIGKALGDHQMISYNLNSLGLIHYQLAQYDSARYYLDRSNQEGAVVNDRAVIAVNNLTIARIYLVKKNYSDAVRLFQNVLAESRAINLREIEKDAYEGLSKSYSALTDYKNAFVYQLRFTQLRDSLLNWEIAQKTIALKAEFDKELQEAKIAELQAEKAIASREKNITVAVFIIVVLFMLAVGALIVRNNHQRKRANQQLQEKNEEIETQNEELTQSREELAHKSELVNEQNQALTQANETKDKLFSIISHDLRGPIASLKSLLGMVAKGEVTGEEFQLMAPKLNKNVGSIYETLENLLQWSYSQMSGLKVAPTTIKLKSVMEGKINLFTEAAKAKHISIVNHVPAEIQVVADENQVRLILRNLIGNAIKFTPDGGKVTVSAIHNDEQVIVKVTDTGIGIPPDRLAELFKPNTRVSTVGTHGEKGTGLGLLLCYEMALRNNGKLTVSSSVGVGTTFTLSLPAPR